MHIRKMIEEVRVNFDTVDAFAAVAVNYRHEQGWKIVQVILPDMPEDGFNRKGLLVVQREVPINRSLEEQMKATIAIEIAQEFLAMREEWFAQACSSGLFDAWHRSLDCSKFNNLCRKATEFLK